MDVRNGFHVCTECGLCVDRVYLETPHQNNFEFKEAEKTKSSCTLKWNQEEAISFIFETCSKLYLEGSDFLAAIVDDCLKLKKKVFENQPFDANLISVLIYDTLKKRNVCTASIIDICHVTKADLKVLWKFQRRLQQSLNPDQANENLLSPLDIIASKKGYLDLTFKDLNAMAKALKKIDYHSSDYSSRTIGATILFRYLKHNFKCYPSSVLSQKAISKLMCCSNMSLYRYNKYLKQNKINLFG